jgi:hypothetical protein
MNASKQIDQQIAALTDWRGKMLKKLRKLIHDAHPDITEEWKWSTAVFTNKGNVCALGSFKDHVKINFFKGASLPDPHGLFNSGLEAKASRSIDLYEGNSVNEPHFKDLIRAAVTHN